MSEIVYAVVDMHANVISGPYEDPADAQTEALYCYRQHRLPFYVVAVRRSQFGPARRAVLTREAIPDGPPDRLDARLALMIAESKEGV